MKRWPTAPVAPNTATEVLDIIAQFSARIPVPRRARARRSQAAGRAGGPGARALRDAQPELARPPPPEEEHSLRTAFQRDRDRVIHSSSFRRLEYKTQVFVNHEGDNYRTRLTHSLEGAQIGRTVARVLGLNEELTEALVLGHDLGHTPFGHSGERAMDELMRDHGGFDHNRQALRILEVLERPYSAFPGLNLTWEIREGIIKHRPDADAPRPRGVRPRGKPDPGGAARRFRGRDRLQQPRHRRRPGLGHDHGGPAPLGGPVPGGPRRGAGRKRRPTSGSCATRWCADHRPLLARPDRGHAREPPERQGRHRWRRPGGRAAS